MPGTTDERSIRFPSAASPAEVPAKLWENLTLVRCRVNGSEAAWFVFDTGATINMLDLTFARELGLNLAVVGPSAGSGQASGEVHGLTLSLSGVELTNQTARVAPLTELALFAGHPLAGVFGYELLRQVIVELDYAGGTLRVFAPDSPDARPRGERLALAVVNKWPLVPVRLEQAGMAPVETRILLDSGSLVPVSLMSGDLAGATVDLPVSAGITGVGSGNSRVGRLGALTIGPWTLPSPPAVFPPAASATAPDHLASAVAATGSGLIGAPVLSRFRLTFDYARQALRMQPYEGWDRPIAWDRSGLVIMAADPTGAAFVVLGVSAGSPAAEAGLQDRDLIVAVDDRPADHLTVPELRDLLKRDGATIVLDVRRGAEARRVTLALRTIV